MKQWWHSMATAIATVMVIGATCSNAGGQWEEQSFRIYSVKHVAPVEVRRMLSELLGDQAAGVRVIADAEQKQVVVSGGPTVQQLASQLIKEVDKPSAVQTAAPSVLPRAAFEAAVLKSYSVSAQALPQRLPQIREIAGPDAKITSDQQRGLVFVVATPARHQALEKLLTSQSQTQNATPSQRLGQWPSSTRAVPVEVADPSVLFPQSTVTAVSSTTESKSIRLQQITAQQCQQALKRLLGTQLQDLNSNRFRYTTNETSTAMLSFDTDTHVCQLQGDRTLVRQFAALIQRFEDSQSRTTGQSFRFVPLKNVSPDVLNKAINLWKQTSGSGEVMENAQSSTADLWANLRVRPAGFVQQVDDDANKAGPANALGTAPPPDNSDAGLRRPSSDVTVQPLPDLDVLILRGRDPDVEELVRIIQEIEKLSDETAPEIEVYFLQHVQDGALNDVIEDVMDELTGPLQGRISITPLVKPNALLLIGWGEAVNAAKQLIRKLDKPVSPGTQMKVFPLRFAPVAEVTQIITEFLNGRGGMGPDVNVSSNPRTNSLIVNASPRDMEEVAQLIQRLDVGSAASVNQAKMVRLKNSLATDVASTITSAITAARGGTTGRRSAALEMLLVQPDGQRVVTSGLLDSVTLTPDVRTNSIFITGPEESLPLIERLIEQLDESPAASAQIKVFEVHNGDASEMVLLLRSLFPVATTSTVPQLATADGESSLVPVRFSVDVRTNTIVATGTSGDLQIIEALLLRLDQTESQDRVNRVYRLKNSPATDVARAVNDFLRSERIVSQAAPGRLNPFQQIEQEVVVVPEPVRNSLIISATPRYFEQILELVEDLDEQPPQVMIQVILAEVDLDNFHEFGVELGLQDSLLFDRSLLGELLTTTVTAAESTAAGVVTTTSQNIVGATNSPGFDFNNNPLGNSGSTQSRATSGTVAGQALSHFSLGRVNSDLEYGGLVLSASSENVSVLLRALDQSGSMEVLSRPQIMTLDNQQAFIQVGERVPRIVNSQLTQLGQINSLELEDVGLLLGVTPRISPEGHVVMEIDAEKSEVGPERDGIPISVSNDGSVIRSPRVEVTTAQTTVSAASGQTIVIGGLITNSNQTLSRRVPWLGDLPLLGNLFRYDGHTNRRTELLIILTPHVIAGRSEAEYLKQVEMSRMSWVSSDVFEWLDAGPDTVGSMNDDGVPVIFPDGAPVIELAPIPNTTPTQQQYLHQKDGMDVPPTPSENPGLPIPELQSRSSSQSVQQVAFAEQQKSDVTSPDNEPQTAINALANGQVDSTTSVRNADMKVEKTVSVSRTGSAIKAPEKPEKKSRFGWLWKAK
ncbi:secretin N-terminal domain-containing protein [Fuerstiella marisgermanici]|uniref:Pullulanase secretion envelope PulD n=1 Tax=Fuerstiella marisgermanici TaxID=1891926 RepID=A0A1P8WHB3_9PLAN|nr:secretin N-terminal domain-containing protein [Fuerstiella marisgermanici]APZ93438.1 Pullulanase secretion envelope PulD [Fuerstiella marisgermanici]